MKLIPMETKKNKVIRYLEENGAITHLMAFGLFGLYRLAATINTLRKEGYDIVTERKQDSEGRQYAEYRLVA